ncbi:MAG TPA: hypothetical protein VFM88_16140 [Vicinamibacteria bacterium]|nr:hypothetical protein [Vicinamibacteria bacterium]
MLLVLLISLLVALVAAALVVVPHARRGRIELPRRKRRILPGGQPVPDDLTKDGYTDDQQYLM